MLVPLSFSGSHSDHNLGLHEPIPKRPYLSDIYDDNLPVLNNPIRINYSYQQNFSKKPIMLPSLYDKSISVVPNLSKLNKFCSQNEVCPIPNKTMPPKSPQHAPSPLRNDCKIWNWLNNIDLHPYVPPECSTAVGFFSNLQNFWQYREDMKEEEEKEEDGILASECDLCCISSLDESMKRTSSLPCSANCPPLSSPTCTLESAGSSKKSLPLSPIEYNGATDSTKEEATVAWVLSDSASPNDVNPNDWWRAILKEETETVSEMAEIWTETPIFASCFFIQSEENHFFGTTPWSWESVTPTHLFEECDCCSTPHYLYEEMEKEASEGSLMIRRDC